MKTSIRHSVFETNSSSCHSLSISKKIDWDTLDYVAYCGCDVQYIQPGIYDWDYKEITDAYEKSKYILTMIQYKDVAVSKKEIELTDSKFWKWLCAVWKEEKNIKLKFGEYHDQYMPYGEIDHMSIWTLDSIWSNEKSVWKEKMRNLIFNKANKIITDNDNSPGGYYSED